MVRGKNCDCNRKYMSVQDDGFQCCGTKPTQCNPKPKQPVANRYMVLPVYTRPDYESLSKGDGCGPYLTLDQAYGDCTNKFVGYLC